MAGMTKEQKQIAVTGVLLIVLVLVWSFSGKKKPVSAPVVPVAGGQAKTAAVQKPAEGASAPLPDKQAEGKMLSNQQERLKLSWGRDPFLEMADKEIEGPNLKLQGISVGKNKKGYALINDEIVREGQKYQEYDVVKIEKDKVLIKKGDQPFYLLFPAEEQ